MTLPTGFNMRLVSTWVGFITGEETVEYLIEGPATFEGQSAVKSKQTMTGSHTVQGFSQAVSSRGLMYEKVQSSGLIATLGAESEFDTTGFSVNGYAVRSSTTTSKTVYSPAVEERAPPEFDSSAPKNSYIPNEINHSLKACMFKAATRASRMWRTALGR